MAIQKRAGSSQAGVNSDEMLAATAVISSPAVKRGRAGAAGDRLGEGHRGHCGERECQDATLNDNRLSTDMRRHARDGVHGELLGVTGDNEFGWQNRTL
jgi:hypothetical protein